MIREEVTGRCPAHVNVGITESLHRGSQLNADDQQIIITISSVATAAQACRCRQHQCNGSGAAVDHAVA